ncbi:myelin and lymphocyte protein-like [Equus asinus]|uniref:Myelin and lymphocyte protein n=1 Tax=Equus asinus TaxID=9793 RepID=A0A9L0ISL9_EQUAS|nr:myelin and lymphocyte protein-like [Equus asinus]
MARSSGRETFTKCPCLFILELVFGGLVWILVASSLVPLPLLQGWVMFASVFCFTGTTVLVFLYMCDADCGDTLDRVYHWMAFLFYLCAFILEVWATIILEHGDYFTYLENVFATVFSCLATLLYMYHAFCPCY